jgi:hypothetical protein
VWRNFISYKKRIKIAARVGGTAVEGFSVVG